jgi:hypothetical protein
MEISVATVAHVYDGVSRDQSVDGTNVARIAGPPID